MLGTKQRVFRPLTGLSLDDLVTPDNFIRRLERSVDLTFVRDLAAPYYAAGGRPSIDPVVVFKLHLIMFFEGIRSERKLMETVHLHLAYRWYIGYDIDDAVPDHSSLTRIRDRYGLETFLRFFERVAELCVQAGLVWGQELYFDGTKVPANADVETLVARFYFEAKQHLQALFAARASGDAAGVGAPEVGVDSAASAPPQSFVTTYSGPRLSGVRRSDYERTTDRQVSPPIPMRRP